MSILPDNTIQLSPAGEARTTSSGRFALPIRVKLGETDLGVFEAVYDGESAKGLEAQLADHLAGRGTSPTPTAVHSEAEIQ